MFRYYEILNITFDISFNLHNNYLRVGTMSIFL